MSEQKVLDVVQTSADGVGPLYHRRYQIRFHAGGTSARAIMAKLQADVNQPSAQLLARFEKMRGEPGRLSPGDIFQIYITGPWNGPVRVAEVTPLSYKFLTLAGHMEAGEIEFSVNPDPRPDWYIFKIESRARSHTRIIDLLYDKLGLMKAAQTGMWDEYCRAVALLNMTEEQNLEVEVLTEREDPATGAWSRIE